MLERLGVIDTGTVAIRRRGTFKDVSDPDRAITRVAAVNGGK